MIKFKKTFYLFWRQMKFTFIRKRIMAGYLVGIISSFMTGKNYNEFLGTHTANVFEAFIQHYGGFGNMTVMLLGFILALSDAPFVHTDSFMTIHRAGRKNWYCAMWGYITVQGILYYGCSFLVSAFCMLRKGYFDNIWGRSLSGYAGSSLTRFRNNIEIPSRMLIEDYTPYTAFLHTFLLIFLCSVLLVGILFALNLYVHTAVGTIIVGVIYLLGMMIPPSWSYVKNAVFSYHMDHQLVLSHSYVLFILSIFIVYFLGRVRLSRVDFQLLEKGEADDE